MKQWWIGLTLLSVIICTVALQWTRFVSPAPEPELFSTRRSLFVAGSHSFPSTFGDRWPKTPVGPVTTWWRALTFVDPNLRVDEIFNSDWFTGEGFYPTDRIDFRERGKQQLEQVIASLSARYGLSSEALEEANKRIHDSTRKWKRASGDLKWALKKANALPQEPVPVQKEFGYVFPCLSRMATKTFGALESLRTLSVWPEEVVVAMGITNEISVRAWEYVQVVTLLRALSEVYIDIVPRGANLRAIFFEPDGGPWSSRLYGIKAMKKAKVVGAIDNDDFMMPDVVKALAAVFQARPDLDYILGGGEGFSQEPDVDRREFFSDILIPSIVLNPKARRTDQQIQDIINSITPNTYKEAFTQYNYTRRYSWYMGSMVGLPNLGVQYGRYTKQPYIELLRQLRSKVQAHLNNNTLPPTTIDTLMGDKMHVDPVYRNFLAHREKQDEQYLQLEVADGQQQDWDMRCNNGWSAGRREMYEHFPPPIHQWQGEDASFSFTLYQSGINTACLPLSLGAYWHWDKDTVFEH